MLTETLVTTAAREGRALLRAVRSAPDAAIQACPGWNATRLLGHVGGVHRFVTRAVAGRSPTRPEPQSSDKPPTGAEPWDWYEEGLAALVDALGRCDPSQPAWSWTDRRDAGFYQRRMAHENTVHRYDAEAATGTPATIDSDIAADGVGEILAVGMRFRSNGTAVDYPESSILLRRTDGADRWFIRAVDGTLLVAHNGDAGNRADATLTGPAEDLYLHLWGRPAPALSVSGDSEAAAAWSAVAP